MDNFLDAKPANFLFRGTDELTGGLVRTQTPAIQRAERNPDRRVVEDGAKHLFAMSLSLPRSSQSFHLPGNTSPVQPDLERTLPVVGRAAMGIRK
jgi:hypothetical protein